MKTPAAVLRKAGTPWEITELDLDAPKANEVLIRMEAAGLCHSDEHIRAKGMARLPMAGGHEGAGVVVERGPGVTRVSVGDQLTELITKKYTLDEINDGYQDLMDGKNIRGVVVHQH